MKPALLVRNFTPSSTGLVSGSVAAGVAVLGQIVHGHVAGAEPTVTWVPAEAAPMLALSSVARLRRVMVPEVVGVKV